MKFEILYYYNLTVNFIKIINYFVNRIIKLVETKLQVLLNFNNYIINYKLI